MQQEKWKITKRCLVCLICVVILLLSGCSKPEQNATHGVYKLTFKTKKISNDHVGNDWSFTYSSEGKAIQNGYEMYYRLDLFRYLPISVEIREDDKYPDVAAGSFVVALYDGGKGSVQVTVTENNGKYKGNTAVWEITCTAKLVDKVYIPPEE